MKRIRMLVAAASFTAFAMFDVFGIVATAFAAPPLVVPHGQLGEAGSGIAPNLLLNLSLTFEDAAAAYRDPYSGDIDYAGYFNPRLCYTYPGKVKGSMTEPEPDAHGYFSPSQPADARHECGGAAFSGNLLNWASAATLDLLRLGLTGGDRVIDAPGLTVLQRAWLPDGAVNPDFYAHPQYFARKSISGAEVAKLTPFTAETLYIVSCRNRILFSSTQKGKSCDAPRFGAGGRRLVSDKYFGEFNVRVSVCTSADSALRPDLCRPYGSSFKPDGAIQNSGKRLRIGIMSYLAEAGAGDPSSYGGALRNALATAGGEIDATTGIATGSGATGLINLLGRSNAKRLGAYKAGDPGAELFYEALRYLQGRAPSMPAAAIDDGLPVLSTRADPILAACQRNIIATIGHPAFAADRYLPGNTSALFGDSARDGDSFAATRFDVMAAARKVGAMEGSAAYGNASPRPDLLHLDTLGAGPSGIGSLYLAGAAYWAHVNPIRRDKGVKVDSFSLELGAAAGDRSSALYLAAKYGAFDDRNGDGNPFVTSAERRDNSEWSADGATSAWFFSGARPQGITNAVREMFAQATPRSSGSAGPSTAWQGAGAGDGASFVITTSADAGRGTGTVQRHALTVSVDGGAVLAAKPSWDAAELLDGNPRKAPPVPTASTEARNIFTSAPGNATVSFKWHDLPADLRAMLNAPARGAPADGLGELRTAFLRGDRSRELGQAGGLFRQRAGILGDPVHSTPLIVGAPPAAGAGDDYQSFREKYKARKAAVYVGSGDGMLHAFSATDGAELFAFIPRPLFADLPALASTSYQPRPWVDGSPAHGEVQLGGAWKTVLASGMGMGARGVFALDISNPSAFDKGAGALWDFTENDDPAIGYVGAPPVIVKLNTARAGKEAAQRYFALVPSGINSLAKGGGALFLLALDKPATQKWQQGDNYYRLATAPGEAALPDALSAPAVVLAPDGSASYAYAGDLQGRLWRFDLRARMAHQLFTARDKSGAAQSIAHAPRVVFAPGGGYLVLFATGKFIEEADREPGSFRVQSMYAIHDRLQTPPAPISSREQLAQRKLEGKDRYTIKGEQLDYFAPDAKRGWYFDFPNSRKDGERAAGTPASAAGAIVFDTLAPGADRCAPVLMRSYVIDAVSGLALGEDGLVAADATTGEPALPGLAMPPLLIETGTTAGSRNATGGATATRTFAFLRPGAASAVPAARVRVSFPAKRLGWREVANWQELHDAATRKK